MQKKKRMAWNAIFIPGTMQFWTMLILLAIIIITAIVVSVVLTLTKSDPADNNTPSPPAPGTAETAYTQNYDATSSLRSPPPNRPLRIMAVGDSTTMGVGIDSESFNRFGWPAILSGSLTNASMNSFLGFGMADFNKTQPANANLSIGSTWSSLNGGFPGSFSLGGGLYTTSSGTDTLTYTTYSAVDTVEVYIARTSSPVQISIMGAAPVLFDPASTTQSTNIIKETYTVPIGSGAITITGSNGTTGSKPVLLLGVVAFASTDKYIVMNCGVAGATAKNWVDNNTYAAIDIIQNVMKPDVAFVNLCINDYANDVNAALPYRGETLTDYTTNYSFLVQQLKAFTIVIGHTPVIHPEVSLDRQTPYVNAARQIFHDAQICWYDFNAECATVENEVALGWVPSNNTHPLKAGYQHLGQAFKRFFITT